MKMKGVKKMKKIILVLVVVLSGIFLLNAAQMQMGAAIYPEQTMGKIFGMLNENMQKMSSAEIDLLYSRCSSEDITDATTLIRLWGALLRVCTESINIMDER